MKKYRKQKSKKRNKNAAKQTRRIMTTEFRKLATNNKTPRTSNAK